MLKPGSFVTVRTNSWGTGKVVRVDEARQLATVDYFDSPTSVERPVVECRMSELAVKTLDRETRVYFYEGKAGIWKMGRISGHIDETCFVTLPNRGMEKVPEEELFVRWAEPIADPIDHLKATLTETPFFQVKRQGLVAHLVRQRAVARGLTALLSAPVFLERHQLEVVTRVLADPVQRYLLADEVGLGKTIEAGMIARQHVLDHPGHHNVIAVVPAVLVTQWWCEFHDRCQLSQEFGHTIGVLSYEQFLAAGDLAPDLLIVDEAHQVTRPEQAALFARLREVSAPTKCAKLLLLSATPVRGNEEGFHGLLHLLDPTIYRLDGLEDFRERVVQRQELANVFVTLTAEQDDYFLEQTVQTAGNLFPRDKRLKALAGELLAELKSATAGEPADLPNRQRLLAALRTHLAESYRLDRRLLRNRRSPSSDGLLPGRAGMQLIPAASGSTEAMERFADLWRERAAKACRDLGTEDGAEWEEATAYFLKLLEAAWTSVECFAEVARERLESLAIPAVKKSRRRSSAQPARSFPIEGERAILESIQEQQEQWEAAQDDRIDSICSAALQAATEAKRVVVMCTNPQLANSIFRRLGIRSTTPVVRCLPNSAHPSPWLQNGILVCDGGAEEGLNLQGGAARMVHVDLPLSPNRLEQRMGRLDRIGKGHAVISAVIDPGSARYLAGWVQLLQDGWGVFNRSIASLQYVVEDEMKSLRRQLFAEGSAAFAESLARVAGPEGIIARELREIHNQDEVDALAPDASAVETLIENIENYEMSGNAFAESLEQWLVEGLHFRRVHEGDPAFKVDRYHYRSAREGGTATLISPTDFLQWFRSGLDEAADLPGVGKPLSWPMATERSAGLRWRVGVARLGHPWIDAVARHLRWDDRGTAVALWRVDPAAPSEPKVFFHFSAIVEANAPRLTKWCQLNAWANARTVVRNVDVAFPPVAVDVWLDPEFLAPSESLLAVLRPDYERGKRDTNLSGIRWARGLAALGFGPQRWADLCTKARATAEAAVTEQHKLPSLIDECLKRADSRHRATWEQLASRREALVDRPAELRQLEQEMRRAKELHQAIQDSVRHVRVRFDSVAAVILSRGALE
ncbi:MAG: protein DpdE [bacterium]|nr:protein DpdE [bacterium]